MEFTKMHGLGNDFILIHCDNLMPNAAQFSVTLCDRYRGIGADGLVFLMSSSKADLRMIIFNSDGTEAEQCGNAIRCVAKYARKRLNVYKNELKIETRRGVQTVWIQEDGDVCVDMGSPILSAHHIPVEIDQAEVVHYPLEIHRHLFHITCVSMGNPHAVIEVSDVRDIPLDTWGPQIEKHALFPNKTNVEFITVHSSREIILRVWERGVGITQACGSGACAAVVAGVLWGKLDREVSVHLDGGDLGVYWDPKNGHVFMTGPAVVVFDGTYS